MNNHSEFANNARWITMSKSHSVDGCCCRFEEDGETQTQWCMPHSQMRDENVKLRKALEEIVDYGKRNPGCGFTCEKMAGKAL